MKKTKKMQHSKCVKYSEAEILESETRLRKLLTQRCFDACCIGKHLELQRIIDVRNDLLELDAMTYMYVSFVVFTIVSLKRRALLRMDDDRAQKIAEEIYDNRDVFPLRFRCPRKRKAISYTEAYSDMDHTVGRYMKVVDEAARDWGNTAECLIAHNLTMWLCGRILTKKPQGEFGVVSTKIARLIEKYCSNVNYWD